MTDLPSSPPSPQSEPIRWYEPFQAPAGARLRRRRRTRPAVAVALAAGSLAASTVLSHALWPGGSTGSTTASAGVAPSTGGSTAPSGGGDGSAATTPSGGGPTDVSSVAAKVNPAVVDINTAYQYQGARGAGTGIVLTSTGEILTNNHVIEGATAISVTDIGNGRTYSARVVGYDATDDVAVIQLIGASGLPTASIDRSGVKVGQAVVAIGNAGGTGGTPSAAGGTITGLNQAITASDELNGTSESLSNLIETDANIQSGDSGGPLVNSSGQVVGMDSAAAQGYSLQSAVGVTSQGYAIPIDEALTIAAQIESGRTTSTIHVGPTAFLGVLTGSSSSGGFGSSTPFDGTGVNGAEISGVVPGGAAERAGLGAGDVITSLDGRTVTGAAGLSTVMAGEKPGDTVPIGWTDSGGTAHTATVTLQSGPAA